MNIIEIKNLTKKYGERTAVDSLSLTVEKGEIFSLLGLNGAGKTTTIKMLACLSEPTSGDAFIDSHSILTDREAVKKIINVSPQETAVAMLLTVRENLEFMAGIYGFSAKESKEKAQKLLEAFKLTDRANERAKKLSGGLQRRLSIAMALISEPEVLFLDEPTLGLDVHARRDLWKHIEELRGKMTIILTTHYLEESRSLSDRCAIMREGKLVTVGTPDEIIKQSGKETFEDAFLELTGGDEYDED